MRVVMQDAKSASHDLPVRGSDLLLILILALGGARTLLPAVADLLTPAGASPGSRFGVMLAVLGCQLALMAGVGYAVAVRLRGVNWGQLGFVALPPGWGVRALGVTIAALPVLAVIGWLQRRIMGDGYRNPQLDVILPETFTVGAMLGTLAITAVAAPLVEETLFRGLLYRWLRERQGTVVGMVLSAAAFALLHGIPALMPGIFVLGLILAGVYERAGSVWAPMIVHAAYNGLVTVVLYAALSRGAALPG